MVSFLKSRNKSLARVTNFKKQPTYRGGGGGRDFASGTYNIIFGGAK